jgi:predicted nucleic-acid-binding protein
MRVTVDTNVLVRLATLDDPEEAQIAQEILQKAELIAVAMPVLCEFVWVLSAAYKKTSAEIVTAIQRLTSNPAVQVDHQAVQAGLHILDAGGDFADGVIAFQGRALGGEIFLTFDRKAEARVKARGYATRLLWKGA